MNDGLRFPFDLPSAEVSTQIRVVVHDANSDASGSRTFIVQGVH